MRSIATLLSIAKFTAVTIAVICVCVALVQVAMFLIELAGWALEVEENE